MPDIGRKIFALVVLVGVGLSACAGPQRLTAKRATPAPVETPVPQTKPKAKPKPVPMAKPAPPVQTASIAPEPAKPPPPPPPPPLPTAADVLKLDPVALADLLAAPQTKRQEASAEVWQYFAPPCVLHVFLYPGQSGGGLRVDHLEATNAKGVKFPTDDCLAVLATARRTAVP